MASNDSLEMILTQNNPPLRQRRQRTNFNDEALTQLEDAFAQNPYPDINERESLAKTLKTSEDRIQVWFQNKRARYRKKITSKRSAESGKKIKNEIENVEQEPKTKQQSDTPVRADSRYYNSFRNCSTGILNDSGYDSNYASPHIMTQIQLNSFQSPSFYTPFHYSPIPLNFSSPYQYMHSYLNQENIIKNVIAEKKPFFKPYE